MTPEQEALLREADERVSVLDRNGLPHSAEIVERLARELRAALAVIDAHNEGCRLACGRVNEYARKHCEAYLGRGLQCPECPHDWMIEVPDAARAGKE